MDTPWLIVFYSVCAALGLALLSFTGMIAWAVVAVMLNGRRWTKARRRLHETGGYQNYLERYY